MAGADKRLRGLGKINGTVRGAFGFSWWMTAGGARSGWLLTGTSRRPKRCGIVVRVGVRVVSLRWR
ncbi:hypothetical protein ACGFZU_35315 [Streptomyces tendae]|uniref:hypothetical protein n=1 Tax=Streptomyces tendae TaxID=1932 RepID=UPI0037230AD9